MKYKHEHRRDNNLETTVLVMLKQQNAIFCCIAISFVTMMPFISLAAPTVTLFEQCVSIQSDTERLACYDKVGLATYGTTPQTLEAESMQGKSKQVTSPNSSAMKPTGTSSLQEQPLADMVPEPVSETYQAPRYTSPSLPDSFESRFGLEHIKKKTDEQELELSSYIYLVESNRENKSQISLVNKQVWRQTQASRLRLKVGDKITIRKGLLGAYILSSENSKRTMRVKRIK